MRAIESSLCGEMWKLTAADGRSWPARVPGCAHEDLICEGIIPDPDTPGGEAAQEWVGRTAFTWSRTFKIARDVRAHAHIELVFESIDAVAEVRLDGEVILRSANQFHPHRVDISARVQAADAKRAGRAARVQTGDCEHAHLLEIECAGPVTEVERLERELGPRPVNGDWTPYPFIRKAACQFGWDWGPRVPSSGPVGAVYLHGWTGARIDSVRPLVRTCSEQLAVVDVFIDGVCDGEPESFDARVDLEAPDGRRIETTCAFKRTTSGAVACGVIEVPDPMRWWPRGYGAQHIHRISVEVIQKGVTLSRWSGRIGLRSASLDTTSERDGSRFAIRVNDQLIWCAGANWIPEGLFQRDPEVVRQRLLQACEANLVMLRVWGGGGYESNAWYELCDELGILAWQDFAFACATYPEDEPFPARVEAEARYQVARLSSHPSVVLWCGGNEDILAWYSWGFRQRLREGQSWGERYWLELLPRICAELDPTRPYWPESPWSGSLKIDPNDSSRGDRHIWDATAKVEGLRSITPRFASEFGHQSPPALRSLAKALQLEESVLAAMSPKDGCALIADRQRATGGDEPQYGQFLSDRFDVPKDFASWVVQAQAVQAKAMRVAYTWYRANRPRCMGALVWQLNDAWTGHSWSLIDVHGRAKPAWHAVRAACAPRMLAVHERGGELVVDAVNDTPIAWKAKISLKRCVLAAGVDGAVAAPIERVNFPEGFVVNPWESTTALRIPTEFLPDSSSVFFVEASTDLRTDPIALACIAGAHERELLTREGSRFMPSAMMEWAGAPKQIGHGALRSTVIVRARTAIVDAIVVPRGDWTSVSSMFFSLPPGGSITIEIAWRSQPCSVELFASGMRIASCG